MAEYIILVLGFVPSNDSALNSIRTDFLRLKYEDCIIKIKSLFQSLETDFKPTLLNSPKEVEFTKNDPRRFFETRLAQYCLGSLSNENGCDLYVDSKYLDSVNKILGFFKPGWSTNPKEIEQDISVFAELGKDAEKYPNADQYKKKSKIYLTKDRDFHPGIARREDESKGNKISTSPVYSSNGGGLLSRSPNFYDSRLKTMRNRVADSAMRIEVKGGGYSSVNN